MKKSNKLSILLNGLLIENPVFVLVLGTCPSLATTSTVSGALGMGIAVTAVLLLSNVAISLLRGLIPQSVRIPCYILIISGFVTLTQMVMHAYFPDIYKILGIYLALIAVNCIILGRAEMFACKNSCADSAFDGIGMGLGFTLALLLIAFAREFLGNASFAGVKIPFLEKYAISIFTKPPGGFLVYGILIALMRNTAMRKFEKNADEGCDTCANGNLCAAKCNDAGRNLTTKIGTTKQKNTSSNTAKKEDTPNV